MYKMSTEDQNSKIKETKIRKPTYKAKSIYMRRKHFH